MKKLLLLPFLLIALLPFTGQAQNTSDDAAIKNTVGLGPRVGFYKANNADEGNFYFGLQSRVRLGAVLGLEGSIEYRAGQKYSVGGQSFETKFVPITASALLFLPVSKNFAPYGIAGLGGYYTIYDADGPISNNTDNEFNLGYHLGFGLELPISSSVALNVDYRYLFLNPNDNQSNLQNTDYSGNVITGGLMFYL